MGRYSYEILCRKEIVGDFGVILWILGKYIILIVKVIVIKVWLRSFFLGLRFKECCLEIFV